MSKGYIHLGDTNFISLYSEINAFIFDDRIIVKVEIYAKILFVLKAKVTKKHNKRDIFKTIVPLLTFSH